ncbi:MAG: type II toxin-antitoxin system HicA family toxin [Candidatus Ratteibacteria bacterium]|nr:type II toxin-antitoxin system HicA family toxin [Candidatus Ratteibacteria bacterium]
MSKLPALKPEQVIRALKNAGFSFVRQKGSHRIYVKGNIGITLPYHNKDLRKGTLRHIIKQSSLTVKEFLDLL